MSAVIPPVAISQTPEQNMVSEFADLMALEKLAMQGEPRMPVIRYHITIGLFVQKKFPIPFRHL